MNPSRINSIRTAASTKGTVVFGTLLVVGVYLSDPLGANCSRSFKIHKNAVDHSVDCSTMDDEIVPESAAVCSEALPLATYPFLVPSMPAISALGRGAFIFPILETAPKQGPPAATFAN